MSDDLLRNMREVITQGEKDLEQARDLIAKLKTAGEDTTELERQYRITKARLDRYKKAFG